ncbi:MAG TPA: UDP-N-acetylmuramoyl-L-alanine--D-glutamate ligase [Candidatus Binataceae bacterium]
MLDLRGKRVMVVGLGISGQAAAQFLAGQGAKLVLVDKNPNLDRGAIPSGEVHLGPEDPAWLTGVDLVVTSPGVPRDSVLLTRAVAAKIPVMGEIELASRFLSAPITAITGTNGKSTVTMLLGEMLKASGMRTFVGGNLGTPLVKAVGLVLDALVVEVSSFQLEWIQHFRPRVGIYLNLSDDHFDRYQGLEDYGAAKARVFENQDGSDWAILNRDDANVWKLAREVRSQVFSFGMLPSGETPAIWPEEKSLKFEMRSRKGQISLAGFRLPGQHNVANAMAASAAALAMFVDTGPIERALRSFRGLPHRLEVVREADGVTWIDDSKGTNVGAVVEALDAVAAPVVLLAGGLDKGGEYAPLLGPFRTKVKVAILFGAAREKMRDALAGTPTTFQLVPTLKDAVELAARIAKQGDTVLLSPACASFDQFKDYAERGNVFQELVRAL